MADRALHTPVLIDEVVAALNPRAGAVLVDGTFGAGGYSRALLEAADCTVWGLDRDPDAVARGSEMAAGYDGRLTVLHGRFGDMCALLAARGVTAVDGVALDLGVSSPQLDDPGRGFSFRADGPLDMRMDPGSGPSAADIVNRYEERDLANIIWVFGEERHSRRIARAIATARADGPIENTARLAGIIRSAMPRSHRSRRTRGRSIDPATRTFQALRICVNDELGELDRGLVEAESLLSPGGRLAVVSFHSLEDRRVRDFLRTRSGGASRPSRHLPPAGGAPLPPSFRLIGRGIVRPGQREAVANPRARSARLRVAERTDAAAWPATPDATGATGATGATSATGHEARR